MSFKLAQRRLTAPKKVHVALTGRRKVNDDRSRVGERLVRLGAHVVEADGGAYELGQKRRYQADDEDVLIRHLEVDVCAVEN